MRNAIIAAVAAVAIVTIPMLAAVEAHAACHCPAASGGDPISQGNQDATCLVSG
jgi:hypothetical protein